jgi:hypothetical protein
MRQPSVVYLGISDTRRLIFRERERPGKMTRLMEIRKERGFPRRLQHPAGFRTFSTGPTAAVTHNGAFSTAAIHLRKADFLSEGWEVPQTAGNMSSGSPLVRIVNAIARTPRPVRRASVCRRRVRLGRPASCRAHRRRRSRRAPATVRRFPSALVSGQYLSLMDLLMRRSRSGLKKVRCRSSRCDQRSEPLALAASVFESGTKSYQLAEVFPEW